MSKELTALQLRLLQTVVAVAAEKNSTLVLPFPVELLRFLERAQQPAPGPVEPAVGPAAEPAVEPAPATTAVEPAPEASTPEVPAPGASVPEALVREAAAPPVPDAELPMA